MMSLFWAKLRYLKRKLGGSIKNGFSLQIFLDGKMIGSILGGKNCTFEIQAGHHTLFVHFEDPLQRGDNFSASSPYLSFDIAPGENAAFLCDMGIGWKKPPVRLWKQ